MHIQDIPVRRITLILVIIFAFILPTTSYATTGGPTYIYSFKYNPANESVYFVQQNEGGRGCPPELLKMSLATRKIDVVFSCDQGESLVTANTDGADGIAAVNSAIKAIIKDFKDLTPISLPKNNITIDVDFVRSEKLIPEDDFIARSYFIAKVFQDATKIAEIPIVGCSIDQPFVFAGYAIPGFEKKILLLLSTKGNCYEGGYTDETLYPLGGINHLDRTYATDAWKSQNPLVLSAATLAVFVKDNAIANATTTDNTNPIDIATTTATAQVSPQGNSYPLILLVVAAVTGALIGFILGALIFRNRRNNNFPTVETT